MRFLIFYLEVCGIINVGLDKILIVCYNTLVMMRICVLSDIDKYVVNIAQNIMF